MGASRGKTVLLRMRHDRSVRGILKDFDSYLNLTLDDAEDVTDGAGRALGRVLVRGDNIVAVSLPDTDEE